METGNLSQGIVSTRASSLDEAADLLEREKFNFPRLILWIAAVVSIVASIGFTLINKSLVGDLAQTEKEKKEYAAKLNTSSNEAIEKEAIAFSRAVEGLKQAKSQRYSYTDFLPAFYQKINKNVKISNIAIAQDGKIAIDGETDSYKAVADQILTLSDWKANDKPVLNGVNLITVSKQLTGGGKTRFTINAYIKKDVKLSTASSAIDLKKEVNETVE